MKKCLADRNSSASDAGASFVTSDDDTLCVRPVKPLCARLSKHSSCSLTWGFGRRSLGGVSVPGWLIILSDQLAIVALVSRYLTNKLIAHRSIQPREARRSPAFSRRTYAVLA